MKGKAKQLLRMMLKNWNTLLWFEIPYKIIGFSFIYSFLQSIFNRILKTTKAPYISQENIGLLFSAPVPIFFLLLAVVLFSYYVYFEITALVLYCNSGWKNEHISILGLWKQTFVKSLRMFYYKNFPVFIIFLPLLAFSVFRIFNSSLMSFKVPEFIMDFIMEAPLLSIIMIITALIINFIVFFYLFGIPPVILEQKNFISSWRESLRLLNGRKRETFLAFFGYVIFYIIAVVVVFIVAILGIFCYSKLFFSPNSAKEDFVFQCIMWGRIGMIIMRIFTSVSVSAIVVMLYYHYKGEVSPSLEKNTQTFRSFSRRLGAVFCSFILIALYSETEMSGLSFFPENSAATKIIAHRAGAAAAPENTLAALNHAVSDNAGAVEIDIQQTRDGILIAMHDSSLKRTAGIDKKVWETDYETIQTLDAGAWYSSEYAGERIPTLEEILQAAQNRIDVMIELKAGGLGRDIEEKTIELINQYHMKSHCVIVSMNIDILKKVKELAPDIKTAYITTMLLSDEYDLEAADAYSVETSFLSLEMASQAHFQGKEVYAWTANSERTIKKALRKEADGIITDNPLLVQYCINSNEEFSLLNFVTQIFYPQ